MKKNKMLIAVFAVLALAGVLLIGASMDFGGPLVVSKAREAVRELLGAELSVGGVRGNPIKGYTLEDVAIVKDKKPLLAAGYMGAKVRVASLLSGSPKLQLLSLGKVNLDADRVAAQVAAMLEHDFQQARRTSVADLRDRSWPFRWAVRAARLFDPIL